MVFNYLYSFFETSYALCFFTCVLCSVNFFDFFSKINTYQEFNKNKQMLFTKNSLLCYLFITPFLGVLLLLVIFELSNKQYKIIVFNITSLICLISLIIWALFRKNTSTFQMITQILWIFSLNLNCTFGIDGISLFFLLITTLLFPLCILSSWNKKINDVKSYLLTFLLLEFFLIGTFLSIELLTFYIFFESVLIPMFLIIGIWGARERKIKAY